jgi:hypothetical protein
MAANLGGKVMRAGDAEGDYPPSPAAPAERITVALIPKAAVDLQKLMDRTGLSKTDITNRAITAYEFIEAQIRAGKEVLIVDPETGQQKGVLLL